MLHRGNFKTYPIGVPIGVPLYCKFLKHFNVIFNLLSCEGHRARMKFRQETWQGQSLIFALLTLEVHPQKNLILTLRYLYQNFRCHNVALKEVEPFCIVTHCYTASFSWKLILCETNIFYSQEYKVWHKDNYKFWKFIINKHEVTLNSFWNFAYVSSYLHSKIFAWKQDYIISQKLQIPQTSPRPF